jgi:hypothetical protein
VGGFSADFGVGRTSWFLGKRPAVDDDFGLQDRSFRERVILMQVTTDDLQGFFDWYVSEETDSVQANETEG